MDIATTLIIFYVMALLTVGMVCRFEPKEILKIILMGIIVNMILFSFGLI